MSEVEITVGVLVAVAGMAWVAWRVVSTLHAGGQSASRADRNAAASLPGAEAIDSLMEEAKGGQRKSDNALERE